MHEEAQKLRLHQSQCPGDLVVMTMAIQSLHIQYPDKFITGVKTNHDAIFTANPCVEKLPVGADVKEIMLHYNRINDSDRCSIHFGQAFCDTLGAAVGLPLVMQTNRPHLFLTPAEQGSSVLKEKTGYSGPYAVVNGGFKDDCEVKWAGTELYQSVVDAHRGRIQFVQVGAEPDKHHHHPRLNGVIDLVGKTSLRELLRLCSRAAFGIGGITFVQHVCAAFQRPYVALIGGREPGSWLYYPTQIPLTAHGLLPCCRTAACWKSKLTANGKGGQCLLPVLDGRGDTIPACMALLKQAAIDTVDVLVNGHEAAEEAVGESCVI